MSACSLLACRAHSRLENRIMRRLLLVLLVLASYLAGFVSGGRPALMAQRTSSRFVNVGTDGPFRIWKDTQTGQCFIVTSPGAAMLTISSC